MQQILFYIPFTEGLNPPSGTPIAAFGVILFLTFVLTALVWGPRRNESVGLPREKTQDLAIVLFLTGIAGARLVYMIQYRNDFPDDPVGLVKSFFEIWKGGIVFYGSMIGGFLGFLGYYLVAVRGKVRVNPWKLADAIAPLLALGLAVGRIGCYLNGCCWGQPACVECQTAPLAGELGQFPLLTAHARNQVCLPAKADAAVPQIHGLQTSTGFAVDNSTGPAVVTAVEPGSAAERAGLKAGDRVVTVDGKPNRVVVELTGSREAVEKAVEEAKRVGGEQLPQKDGPGNESGATARVAFPDAEAFAKARAVPLPPGVTRDVRDDLWELARDWPRGRGELVIDVQRGGTTVPLSIRPTTVPFFPTQLYETVSMILLILLLLAFQPFRRHDGQVMELFLVGYGVHRFLNEAIRIEPTYALGLTLSQWISVGILLTAAGLEVFLRLTRPKLPPGPLPLSYGVEKAKA